MRLAMPQLGESVTEGTIIKWLKSAGEHVGLDEPLVEIETEKVNVEVPSPWEGVLSEILVPEGETVSVGTELATIEEGVASPPHPLSSFSGERVTVGDEVGAQKPASMPELPLSRDDGRSSEVAAQSSVLSPRSSNGPHSSDGARRRYSPAVLRLAEEHSIDMAQVSGSGLGGRVTRKDLMNVLEHRGTAPASAPSAAEQPALEAIQESAETPAQAGRTLATVPLPPRSPEGKAETSEASGAAQLIAPAAQATPPVTATAEAASMTQLGEDEDLIHPSPTRRAIAAHMVRSVQTAPHAWMVVEVDMTRLVRFRESIKASFREREGVDLSYLPFMIKATVLALKESPRLNASWREGEIVLKRRINIGIAVNTPEGLMVPVIHNADNYSIAGLARVAADLAARARARRLKLEEVQGGTFTVDNTGVFGSVVSAPIINQPQAAIVTMEAIVKRPVVIDDAIAVRSIMNSCISFDHRVVDGGEVGPFMQSLKRHLESFGPDTPIY